MSMVLSIDDYKETINYQKKKEIKTPPIKVHFTKYSTQEIEDLVELETNNSSIEEFHKKWDK